MRENHRLASSLIHPLSASSAKDTGLPGPLHCISYETNIACGTLLTHKHTSLMDNQAINQPINQFIDIWQLQGWITQ